MRPADILPRLALTVLSVVLTLALAPVVLLLILVAAIWSVALDLFLALVLAGQAALFSMARFAGAVAEMFAIAWEP